MPWGWRWLWRSRMARYFCRHDKLGFDAPRCVNTAKKYTLDDVQIGGFESINFGHDGIR